MVDGLRILLKMGLEPTYITPGQRNYMRFAQALGFLWVTKLRHNGPVYLAKKILSPHRINGYNWHVTSRLQPVY